MENFKIEHAVEIEEEKRKFEVRRLVEAKTEDTTTGGEEIDVGSEG